jgi:hypothetical protein
MAASLDHEHAVSGCGQPFGTYRAGEPRTDHQEVVRRSAGALRLSPGGWGGLHAAPMATSVPPRVLKVA